MSRVDRVDRVDWVDGADVQESCTLAAVREAVLPRLLSGEGRVGRGQSGLGGLGGRSGREGLGNG